MAGNIQEDAGPLNRTENELLPEPRRRVNSLSIPNEERRRTSSVRSDVSIYNFKNDFGIAISPEDIPDEYEQNENQSGLFVLFNNENFLVQDEREGTMKDEEDLIDCLSRLRYEIKQEFLFKDYGKHDIEAELHKIARMDHSKRSSLIVVFLTHGITDGKLSASDEQYIKCEDIWNYFTGDKCPSLIGKPKIFIFQACKGKAKSQVTYGVQEDSVRRVDVAKKNYTLPAEADILVAYSTQEGNVSYRNSLSGSWFIQELCKNLTAYGRRDDFVSILTRVSKCVAYHYYHEQYKQMPCFISTLTRKFYLCKSKERGYLLELHAQNKILLEKLENMEQKLQELSTKKNESTDKCNKTVVDKPVRKNSSKSSLSDRPRWK